MANASRTICYAKVTFSQPNLFRYNPIMYKQFIFLVTSIVTVLPQVSIAAPKGFQSPSGNMFCELIPGETNSLRCEINTSLKPKPPQPYPGYCGFDWGMGFLLPADARPEILCISDTSLIKINPFWLMDGLGTMVVLNVFPKKLV